MTEEIAESVRNDLLNIPCLCYARFAKPALTLLRDNWPGALSEMLNACRGLCSYLVRTLFVH